MALKFKNPFKTEPSLEELQERQERDTYELDHVRTEALIAKLNAEHKRWQEFSTNGKKSGFDMSKALAWLRGNKKGSKK